MDRINLDSKAIYEILKKKKLNFFYHANTVKTSLTFLDNLGLLSRGFIESNNLNQTPQISDIKDKEFGIWNSIFLDAKDLSSFFNKPNVYGPILFAFNIEILLRSDIPYVRITRFNPCYWTQDYSFDELYYTKIDDFNNDYNQGNKYLDGGISFIFNTLNGKFTFDEYFIGLSVDDTWLSFPNENGLYVNYSKSIINWFELKLKGNLRTDFIYNIRTYYYFQFLYNQMYLYDFKKFQKLFYP